MVYHSVADVDFRLEDCPALPQPARVLLTTPDYFDVAYVINPHMAGNIGDVDAGRAGRQWAALRQAYETLGFTANVVHGREDVPDMVFCANQTLPYYRPDDGTKGVVLSNMFAEERRPEVEHYAAFFRQIGFTVDSLPQGIAFEGMGDALWHPGRYLLWGGYGFRTDPAVYEHLARHLDARVLVLTLTDPDFYHLDTCLAPLDEHTALLYPGAFDAEGRALIGHFFDTVIEAPEDEARNLFACNAHCPDGEHVLIQRGCDVTNERLREAGFSPVELDTDEFLKAGGSVFCMKLMFWP